MDRIQVAARARRRFLMRASAACALPWVAGVARAAETRPLRVIVPFAAGGPSDVVLRAAAERLRKRTGQALVVEHRAGASGSIGAQAARAAEPDGHTLLFAPADVLVNNTAIFRALPYAPLQDFVPLVRIGPIPLVLVVAAESGATDLAAFAAWARGRRIAYGSWGEGSHAHLLGDALLAKRLQLDVVHAPYRGMAPMVQDLLGGQIDAAFAVAPTCVQHVQAGRLHAVAVTGNRRSAMFPDVPTLAELGHADAVFGLRQWAAFLAPARTPPSVVQKLEAELKALFDAADMRSTLLVAGFELDRVLGTTETEAALREELALIPPLIRALGVPQL